MQDRRASSIGVSAAKTTLLPSFPAKNKYMDAYDPTSFVQAKEDDCNDAMPPFDRSVHLLLRKSVQPGSVLLQRKAISIYGQYHDHKLHKQSPKLMMSPRKS
mmetsp:Transcript_34215/g.50421  ORF Transcript_34215/g.50421 Transcript_34215/m.50421 type:complete len:102 (-) Transcript_34215:957-1262(-)